MRLSLIAAMAPDRLIGRDGALPWRLPSELRRFKRLTMGKPLVMGRRTFESIGRPLPGRRCVVLSRTLGEAPPGIELFADLDAALAALGEADEVMIGGGARLYAEALPRADRLCVSVVHGGFGALPGDVYFPPIDAAEWRIAERIDAPADPQNPFAYSYFDLRRADGAATGLTPAAPFPAAIAMPAPPGGA